MASWARTAPRREELDAGRARRNVVAASARCRLAFLHGCVVSARRRGATSRGDRTRSLGDARTAFADGSWAPATNRRGPCIVTLGEPPCGSGARIAQRASHRGRQEDHPLKAARRTAPWWPTGGPVPPGTSAARASSPLTTIGAGARPRPSDPRSASRSGGGRSTATPFGAWRVVAVPRGARRCDRPRRQHPRRRPRTPATTDALPRGDVRR